MLLEICVSLNNFLTPINYSKRIIRECAEFLVFVISSHFRTMNSKFIFTKENVDARELEIMQNVRAAYGHGEAAFTRNVRAKTDWEQLYDAFPAPITPQL